MTVLLLSQLLLAALFLQCPGDVTGQFSPAPPTCPGDTFIFTCNVTGDMTGTTLWRVDGSSSLCSLPHISTGTVGQCGPGNLYTATPVAGFGDENATLFTSTLSARADPTLNGILVECFGPVSSTASGNMVGSGNIQIIAPPGAPRNVAVSFTTPGQQFNVTWIEPPPATGGTVDTYFVSISGPSDLCGNGNTPQNVTEPSYTCTIQSTPQEGETYTITVVAATCDGRLSGPNSDPVLLQVPDAPTFTFQPDCPDLVFVDIDWQNTSAVTEVCVNYCTGNCTEECRNVSGNDPFRINNIVRGTTYNISLSLRNDFGQSGETAPQLYVNDEGQCVIPTPTPTPVPPTTPSPTLTQPPTETPTQSPPQTQPPTTATTRPPPVSGVVAGAIAGGVIGGIIGAAIVVLLVIIIAYCIWKKVKDSPKEKEGTVELKSNKSSKPVKEQQQVASAYDEVDTQGQNPYTQPGKKIEVEKNVAYEDTRGQLIKLKENEAYEPVTMD